MPSYDMLFGHDITVDAILGVGDAFRWDREIWQVKESSRDDDGSHHLVLRLWPNGVEYPAVIAGESRQ